jgi:two-component system, OmpR family, response regulator MprA
MAQDASRAMVVDATLDALVRALAGAPRGLTAGTDPPVMVVVLAHEAERFADSLGIETTSVPPAPPSPVVVGYGDLVLDAHTREVHRGGRLLSLTVTEFRLLEFLLRHPRQVLPRGMIFDRVWGFDLAATSNSLTVYVGYLRRKTEAGGEPRLIHTVRGIGYVLRD